MTQLRGLQKFNGVLYALRGDKLYSIDGSGTPTQVGTIGSTAGPVDFAVNTIQLGITDGTALWVWDGTTFQQNTDYEPGDRLTVAGQRLFFSQANTQRVGYTALANMMSIDALDFFSAERVPDNLVGITDVYGQLLLLGSESGEVWEVVGGTDVVARNDGAYIEQGLAAAHSLKKVAGSCMWLSSTERGQASVMQLQGYQAKPVSTRAIEERFEGIELSGATAYTRSAGKQEFYCLNVPALDTTLVYDTTWKQWHEEAELVDGQYQKFRARCHAFVYGKHWIGAEDGNLYQMDPEANTFAGDPKCRDRVSPVISHPSIRELQFPKLGLMCEKATNGTVLMRYSDDNGATWSNWHTKSAGETGEHRKQVVFRRLGRGYDRVYQVRMTDDAAFNPISADAMVVV